MTTDLSTQVERALMLQLEGQVIIAVGSLVEFDELRPEWSPIPGERLITGSSLKAVLPSKFPGKFAKIVFQPEDITQSTCGVLNQQREQLYRSDASVLLCVPTERVGVFARFAPDLWNWATVIGPAEPKPASPPALQKLPSLDEEGIYAPRLDPSQVRGPEYELSDPAIEEHMDER